MKKLSKLLLVLAVALFTVGCFAGCGGRDSVSEIYINQSEKPQTTLVQGNDFNLESGALTVVKGGKEESIPFTTEGITITDYDKNTLGAQTVTITYKKKTTTIDVTVIPRMVVQNVDFNYFVGDDLNLNKGQVRIAKDDGTTFTVALNASTITVEGFDSTSAATNMPVTVRYQSGSAVYETTYNVSIFAPESIMMNTPSKTKYSSHHTKEDLDLSGVYFTITANGGTMTKYVNVTPDMVTGFNPSEATIDNRTEPLSQTLTVDYLGHIETYTIKITYSGVSIMRRAAEILSIIDWTQESITLNEEQGTLAIDAMQEYVKLNNSDKALITEQEKVAVVRTAAVYAIHQLKEEAKTFDKTFVYSDDGSFSYIGESYEAVAADYERLLDSDEPFIALGNLLRTISTEFGDLVIGGKVTVGSYLANVYNEESLDLLLELNKLLIELYESLASVPVDWTMDDIKDLGAQIGAVSIRISVSHFVGYNYTAFYDILSSWREKDDFFDIVYAYYLYNEDETKKNAIGNTLWDVVPQPKPLQDIFLTLIKGISEENYITSNMPLWYDTSALRLHYKRAMDARDAIFAGDNQLHKDLYNFINYDSIIASYLISSDSGITALSGGMFDDEIFDAFWNQFLDLLDTYEKEGLDFDFTTNEKIPAVFKAFVELSPSWQRGVLNSMYTLYDEANISSSALEYTISTEVSSYFVAFLANYYMAVLPEKTVEPLFQKLLYAIEDYATRYKYADGESSFKKLMGEIQAAYDLLSVEDKAAFNQHIGFAYEKYIAIAEGEEIELNEWADTFAELQGYLNELDAVSSFLADKEIAAEEKEGAHVVLFTVYEKIAQLVATIRACGDEQIIAAFNTMEFPIGATEAEMTLEYGAFQARAVFMGYMLNSKISITEGKYTYTYIAWDLYCVTDVNELLIEMYDVFYNHFSGEVNTLEDVAAAMAAFRAEDAKEQDMFFVLDADVIYYAAINATFAASFNETELAMANALIAVEKAYASYLNVKEEGRLTAFEEAVATATELLSTVESSENYQTYLKDMYEYYLAKAEEFASDAEETPAPEGNE